LLVIALAASLEMAASFGETAHPTDERGRPAVIAGPADVVDGDTIVIAGTRVRLEGIDAPEADQTCNSITSGPWACGKQATGALAQLIGGKSVRCESRGLDRYGRTLGVCSLGELDVNSWMVRQGHAWAFVKYSASYVQDEEQARSQRIGIWQGDATPAWEHRARQWASAENKAPQGCAIKGNVTAHGKIYHMPWSPWYTQIKMDPERGRRWFCTEAEAIAAGWRPVNTR
jgi:endonuclease YncB( thermonuclease family)